MRHVPTNDPNDSAKSILLDNLPGQQGLTSKGDIRLCGIGAALGATVAPLFALTVVADGLWLKLSR
jgi:hypothetical protein